MLGMKPNFALKLSNDGVELAHRAPSGWLSVGTVDFAAEDVSVACAALLEKAAKLAPEGIRTKLVLPESELRYATVIAPGPTDEARRYQIEAEIEALTPYSIDDLTYDWVVEDDAALVAICARETLAEAEGFAEGYGFNPVSIVAAPESGQFQGEPFLGESTSAAAILAAEGGLQRDSEPVRITGKVAGKAVSKTAAPKVEAPKTVAPKANSLAKAPEAAPQAEPASPSAAQAKPPSPAASTPIPAEKAKAEPASKSTKAPDLLGKALATTGGAFGQSDGEDGSAKAKMSGLVRRMGTRLRREKHDDDKALSPLASPLQGQEAAPKEPAKAWVRPSATAAAAKPAQAAPVAPKAPPAAPVTAAPKAPVAKPLAAETPQPAVAQFARPKPASDAASVSKPALQPEAQSEATSDPKAEAKPDMSGTAAVAFSTRRTATPTVVAEGGKTQDPAQNPGGRIAVIEAAGQQDQRPPLTARLKQRAEEGVRKLLSGGSAAALAGVKAAANPGGNRARKQDEAASVALGGAAALGTSRRASPAQDAPIVAASRPPVNEQEKASEAEALTIFGARGNQSDGGVTARRGLMAGGGVLLLGTAVAIWMLYFNGSQPADPTQPVGDGVELASEQGLDLNGQNETISAPEVIATTADPAVAEAGQSATPAALSVIEDAEQRVELAGVADGATDEAVAQTLSEAQTQVEQAVDQVATQVAEVTEPQTTDPQTTDPDALLEQLVDDALSGQDATTELAALPETEVVQSTDAAASVPADATPSQPADAQRAAVTSQTPEIASSAATRQRLSLPSRLDAPPSAEMAIETPTPPPPFGAEFDLDENGLVVATAEGALTPSGVTVFAGRPDAVPAPRPAAIAALAPPPPAPEPEAAPEAAAAPVVAPDTPRADPALAGARPQPRSARVRALAPQPAPEPEASAPEDPQQDAVLIPDQAETETAVALQTPPPGGVSLAGLRPQRRPTDLVSPSVDTAEVAEDESELDLSEATEQAVAASLVPSGRPSNLAERAERILAAQRANPEPEESAPAETASAAAAPSIPSSASVARSATETNAIRLNRINLIGVFGTPSARRALVRTARGRVVRVAVGDRLDGGRVTAIGANELRYTKNGRNERLEIDE